MADSALLHDPDGGVVSVRIHVGNSLEIRDVALKEKEKK